MLPEVQGVPLRPNQIRIMYGGYVDMVGDMACHGIQLRSEVIADLRAIQAAPTQPNSEAGPSPSILSEASLNMLGKVAAILTQDGRPDPSASNSFDSTAFSSRP